MNKRRFWRIAALVGLCLNVAYLGQPSPVGADSPLTFSGALGTFLSNTTWTYVDTDAYTVYGEAGQAVSLDLAYAGICGHASARLDVSIGVPVGSINIPPTGGTGVVNFSGSQAYARMMPTTGEFQISLTLNSVTFGGIPSGCNMSYDLTMTGATLAPESTLVTEAAAGLTRVVDFALPIVIYTPTFAAAERGEMFIDIRDVQGRPVLYLDKETLVALPEFPTENLLIDGVADGFVRVYKLKTGEYQVNVGPLADGKVHVVIFEGIPPTRTYGYTF